MRKLQKKSTWRPVRLGQSMVLLEVEVPRVLTRVRERGGGTAQRIIVNIRGRVTVRDRLGDGENSVEVKL